MIRPTLAALAALALAVSPAVADDKKPEHDKTGDKKPGHDKDHAGQKATITKMDAKNHTVTVKMPGKDGKMMEKKFKLVESIRYMDSTGKVAAEDIFANGDDVLILEADGQLKQMQQKTKAADKKKGKSKDSDKGK